MGSAHPCVYQTKESEGLIRGSGCELLVEGVEEEDVDFMLGYGGGGVLGL